MALKFAPSISPAPQRTPNQPPPPRHLTYRASVMVFMFARETAHTIS